MSPVGNEKDNRFLTGSGGRHLIDFFSLFLLVEVGQVIDFFSSNFYYDTWPTTRRNLISNLGFFVIAGFLHWFSYIFYASDPVETNLRKPAEK